MAFVPAVVSSKKGLADRIRRILKDSCGNPRTGAAWALAVSAITICVALGVAFAQTRPAKPDVESAPSEPNEPVDSNEPMVSVNFKNVEFKTLIQKLADWTGKTIIPSAEVLKQKVTMYAPQRLRKNEAVAVTRNALRAKGYIVEETAKIIYIRRVDRPLPAGWSLDYDDGLRAGGARTWPGNMARDLVRIRIRPYNLPRADSKGERYEFEILSLKGGQMGTIHIRPESERDLPDSKILKPGKYFLRYQRRWGPPGDNFRIESGEYSIDLSKPGMYELTFSPKIGNAEITGNLDGCYAVNLERIGQRPWFRGFAYLDPRLDKQFLLDGLPAGKYLLSAVGQQPSGNVAVDRTMITVAADEKVTIDMARPAKGSCTLKGTILGKQRGYRTPWPDTWPQSQGKWFVLIRAPGSGPVDRVDAYEALTMDSLYVVRGHNLTTESEDRTRYQIEGVAPGDYTVTAIEHPSWGGCVVTRQQSKRLTIRPAENVLDFDLRITPPHNPGAGPDREDSGKASAGSDESAAEAVNKDTLVQRSYRLKNYSPAEMSRIVEPMLSDFGHQSSDEKTSTLLIIDTVETLARIEKIIEQFDVLDAERFVTEVFQIYHGDPSDIVQILARLLRNPLDERPVTDATTSGMVGLSGQPIVLIPEQRRQWIIAKASAADMKQIAEWIEKLDKVEKVQKEYETVQLRYADVNEVAKRLNEVIRDIPGTELQHSVLIQPLRQARQIIIFGRKDQREMVKKLISEIDVPLDPERIKPRIFTLRNSDPIRMAKLLTTLFAGKIQ